MGLETAQYVEDLNPLWPLSTDKKQEGDDQFRLLKSVLQNMTASQSQVTAKDNRVWLSAAALAMDIDFTGAITKSGQGIATLGDNTFTSPQTLESTSPTIYYKETGVTPNNTLWRTMVNGEALSFQVVNDALNAATSYFTVERNLNNIDSVTVSTSGSSVSLTQFGVNIAGTVVQANGVAVATVGANTFTGMQLIDSAVEATFRADAGIGNSATVQLYENGVKAAGFEYYGTSNHAVVISAISGAYIDFPDEESTINIVSTNFQKGGVDVATVDQLDKTYGGFVSSGGTSNHLPSGWSAVRESTGLYTITHNLGVAGISDFFATANAYGSSGVVCDITSIQTNSFQVDCRDSATQGVRDSSINFICTLR